MFKKKALCKLLALGLFANVLGGGIPIQAKTLTTINWNQTYQEIDGFGVSQAEWSDELYNFPEPARSEIMDYLFSTSGIDLDIFRGEVFHTFLPSPNTYDFSSRPDQVWVMQEAKARGVDKFMATTWSPPAFMKTNNQTTHGGFLKKEYYQDYAELLANFIIAYKNLYGIDLYAISMANEPNSMTFLSWNSCEWTGEQMRDFLVNYLKPTFDKYGLTGYVNVIAGEPSWWKEDMMKPTLNDPTGNEFVDIIAAHNYPIPILNIKQPQVPFDLALSKGKKVWMTEVSSPETRDTSIQSGLFWAKEMHTFLTKVNANAYLYWTGAIPGSNDEGLIKLNPSNGTYELTKRYYAFGNYSKFIKPGFVRIDMPTKPTSGVYTSAFKNPSGTEMVIVAVNDSMTTKELTLVPNTVYISQFTPYITNSELDLTQMSSITPTSGSFDVTLPPESIVTFIGSVSDEPIPVVKTFQDSLDTLDYTHQVTTGMALDISSPHKFGNDVSRLKRTTESTESVIYQINNISSFDATLYHHTEWDGVTFYTSSDGTTWERIPHVSTPGDLTSLGWYRKVYSSVPQIGPGQNYLKIELSGPGSWNKQIGSVNIHYNIE